MSGLILKLGPRERLLINGAVIENGERRSRVKVITDNAKILRLKDAIHPNDANTPIKRACYLAQLLLSGDLNESTASRQLIDEIETLKQVFADEKSISTLLYAKSHLQQGNAYSCLKLLRSLLPIENHLLSKI